MTAQRKRILLVDDDRDFAEATTAVLESVYDVDVAYGGVEAMDKARAAGPDLILLDVIMPDEDGFAVCDQLKADPHLADVPVILLTSLPNGLGPLGKRAIQSHVGEYLEKPVKPMELLRQVAKFLAQEEQSPPRRAASQPARTIT